MNRLLTLFTASNSSKAFIIFAIVKPKRVTSLQGPPPQHSAKATQLRNYVEILKRENTTLNLAGHTFESQTFRNKVSNFNHHANWAVPTLFYPFIF